jgi:hypothetical protein
MDRGSSFRLLSSQKVCVHPKSEIDLNRPVDFDLYPKKLGKSPDAISLSPLVKCSAVPLVSSHLFQDIPLPWVADKPTFPCE